ncbi:MAG: TusE/DsrC/DsvC family sulfur relay protein [Gammaproteobacteria bacterium]|nr:TusE/DsrC/DsvC family sulfur relay protein [Gammaproteobacteria bacterium]
MICISVKMKFGKEVLKRVPVELILDNQCRVGPQATDRAGMVCFDQPVSSGKVMVAGVERYQGRLEGDIDIELWSLAETGFSSDGATTTTRGSNAYPNMTTRTVEVAGREIMTDSEGYLVDPADWSEEFVRQQAEQESLQLTAEHWEMIRFQRSWFADNGRQATVRDMIKYFRKHWDAERGSNRYLHKIFPYGGPQKQGNRLAGLLRTKGEH